MLHRLAAIAMLLSLVLGAMTGPIRQASSQIVTPDPSPPDFSGQQFVIALDNLTPGENRTPNTFATAELDDPGAFPATTVKVHNYQGQFGDQRFWLSVRITQQDPGVEVKPANGYAEMELIAPGADAEYAVTFPASGGGQVAFEVDGGTEEAALLTVLQFALDAGFAAADIAGVGSHDQEIGLELANVVAEQYLADLPTFVPCANAVAAVQRGLPDEEQFVADVDGCLASPVWQASVDEVLSRVAERDWFQQSLGVAGKAVPAVGAALKAVEAQQLATQVFGMYRKFDPGTPGAMVGTVAFLAIDTVPPDVLGAATAMPDLSVFEVVGRAQAAVQEAGTYRWERYTVEGDARTFDGSGQVDIEAGERREFSDGSVTYWVDFVEYRKGSDGSWSVWENPPRAVDERLRVFLRLPGTEWTLIGSEVIEGRAAYGLRRSFVYQVPYEDTLWIDAATFLPVKAVLRPDVPDLSRATETTYSGFGEPVDVEVPAEALAPTPTPEPTPPPIDPAAVDPLALLASLGSSVSADELPLGYEVGAVGPIADDDLLTGSIGGMRINTTKAFGMAYDNVEFYLFDSEERGSEALQEASVRYQRFGLTEYGVTRDFGFPSTQLGGAFSAQFIGTGVVSMAMVQVGNTLIVTTSYALPGAQAQADQNAADLATAGLAILNGAVLDAEPASGLNPEFVPAPTRVPPPVPDSADTTVALHDIYFDPKVLSISADTDFEIALPNGGAAPHDFNIDEIGLRSGIVEPDTTGTVTVNLGPGEYEFYCSVPGHKEAGMVGMLVVE